MHERSKTGRDQVEPTDDLVAHSEHPHDALERVREFLTAAVKEGAYAPGSRLPTERELATRFSASRAIARRALSELEKEGLIERHVGRGTFVARPRGHGESIN